jgi:hypothetical protein
MERLEIRYIVLGLPAVPKFLGTTTPPVYDVAHLSCPASVPATSRVEQLLETMQLQGLGSKHLVLSVECLPDTGLHVGAPDPSPASWKIGCPVTTVPFRICDDHRETIPQESLDVQVSIGSTEAVLHPCKLHPEGWCWQAIRQEEVCLANEIINERYILRDTYGDDHEGWDSSEEE